MGSTIHSILCETTFANNGAILLKVKWKLRDKKSILKTKV